MMPNLILEIGMLMAFSLGNTPWEPKRDFQKPYLMIEKSIYEDFYFKSLNSSRTEWARVDAANPKTMLWTVEFGYKTEIDNGIFKLGIGHTSEHEVNNVNKHTESYHYLNMSYRLEYP